MKRTETLYSVDIETSLNETNSLERYIGSILENENFNSLNYLQVQKSRNRRRCSMRRSCTFVRKHSTEIKCIKFHGVSERKEYTHDI